MIEEIIFLAMVSINKLSSLEKTALDSHLLVILFFLLFLDYYSNSCKLYARKGRVFISNVTSHDPMKFVLKYMLRGFYIGNLSLILTVIIVIFVPAMNENESVSAVIPYLHAVHSEAVIPYPIPPEDTTFTIILNYYGQWALLMLFLPLVIGGGSCRMRNQQRCNKEDMNVRENMSLRGVYGKLETIRSLH